MSSIQADGSPGPPALTSVANPPDDTLVVPLLTTPPGVSTAIATAFFQFQIGPAGFTSNTPVMYLDWIDPTGQLIYRFGTRIPNYD